MGSRKLPQISLIQGLIVSVPFPVYYFSFYSFQWFTLVLLEVKQRGRKIWMGHLNDFLADLDKDSTKQKKRLLWRQRWS